MFAGTAVRDISPAGPVQLCGYPNVRRVSTGIHDPLLASVLYLRSDTGAVLLCSLDILMLNTDFARQMRREVAVHLGMEEACVLVSCTHTHSGPVTLRYLPFDGNVAMPPPDTAYLETLRTNVLSACEEAKRRARPAEAGWGTADATGVGGNRLSPSGPTDPEAGVLVVRSGGRITAIAVIYGMHPTVLHEDSTLVSSDFPHYVRETLREELGGDLVVLYHTAPCGNQSPRRFVTSQTFAEAERLGSKLGFRVAFAAREVPCSAVCRLRGAMAEINLPRRVLPPVQDAEAELRNAKAEFSRLSGAGAPVAEIRTAEVNVFGAEASLRLALLQASWELDQALNSWAPFVVQALRIGDACMAGVPGEMFVEYSLEIKLSAPMKTFVTAFANGELQGYIVTPEARRSACYEAASRSFEPESGPIIRDKVIGLLKGVSS